MNLMDLKGAVYHRGALEPAIVRLKYKHVLRQADATRIQNNIFSNCVILLQTIFHQSKNPPLEMSRLLFVVVNCVRVAPASPALFKTPQPL